MDVPAFRCQKRPGFPSVYSVRQTIPSAPNRVKATPVWVRYRAMPLRGGLLEYLAHRRFTQPCRACTTALGVTKRRLPGSRISSRLTSRAIGTCRNAHDTPDHHLQWQMTFSQRHGAAVLRYSPMSGGTSERALKCSGVEAWIRT